MTDRPPTRQREHRLDAAVGVGEGGNPDDGAELVQGDSRGWIVEVDLARLDLLLQSVWQHVCIDLEADGQRGFWRDARTDTAVLLTGNGFMQMKCVAPKASLPNVSLATARLRLQARQRWRRYSRAPGLPWLPQHSEHHAYTALAPGRFKGFFRD